MVCRAVLSLSSLFLVAWVAQAHRIEAGADVLSGGLKPKTAAGAKGRLKPKGLKPVTQKNTSVKLADVGPKCTLHWEQVTKTFRAGADVQTESSSTATLELVGDCASTGYLFRLTRFGRLIAHWSIANSTAGKSTALFTFRSIHQNRRYHVEIWDGPKLFSVLHVYVPTAPSCEGSVFTTKALQCSRFPEHLIPKDSQSLLKKLRLSNQQAYAVEFEGVLRRPPSDYISRTPAGRWAAYEQKHNFHVRDLVDEYFKTGTWAQSVQKLVDNGERQHYQKVSEAYFFPALNSCFKKVIGADVKQGKRCISPRTCGFSGFCATTKNRHRLRGNAGECHAREECIEDAASVACPKELTKWPWMFDSSVMPMTEGDTADAGEWDGVPVEIVAPGPKPPNHFPLRGATGLRNIGETMASLRWMGLQMGPSTGMHVHVNIKSVAAGGDCCLHDKQVARIWTAFAKYQFVIDELMTSARVTNAYAVGLLLGDARVAAIFANVHDFFNRNFLMNNTDGTPNFCNSALGVTRDPQTLKKTGLEGAWAPSQKGTSSAGKVCEVKGVEERYTALNLHSLKTHGTIEFRQHAGTHDVERVLRWVQFVVAFVNAYRNSLSMDSYFDNDILTDWRQLYLDQLKATPTQLFTTLKKYAVIDEGSQKYFATHAWAKQCPMLPDPTVNQVTVGKGFRPSPLVETVVKLPDPPSDGDDDDEGPIA